MSKLLKLLLSIVLALCLSVAFVGCDDSDDGDNVVTGEFVYELVESEEEGEADYYKITGYTVSSDDALKMAEGDFSGIKEAHRKIKIPATYAEDGEEKLEVKEIGSMAFADQIILTSVDFTGSNIETIGVGAFSGCTSLEEIINLPFIGKDEKAIGEERVLGHLFSSVSTSEKNTSVTAKVYSAVEEADVSFTVPTSLKKVTTTATIIPECAFYGLTMLETVEFANATSIGKSAFNGCTGIIYLNLPAVEYLYDGAFEDCSALQEVDFGQSLKYVGDGAFLNCSRLGYNFVSDDETILTVTIPNTVTYLGEKAFSGCTTLRYVVLGENVATLYTGTFADCIELKKVKTLASAVEFKASVFAGCEKAELNVLKNDGSAWTLKSEVYGEANVG